MSNTQHADDLLLTRLYMALEKMESELNALKRTQSEPIAIIGLGCRFPGGADNPERFWQLLNDGVDAISEVPPDRWDVDAYYDPEPGVVGKMYTRHGGFLKQVDKFDPLFFGISPREAVSLDPQQRLLLEVSWEALEHANQVPADLFNSLSGVFLGISTNDYSNMLLMAAEPSEIGAYAGTGNAISVAAGRLSYALGLTGPCMAVDTACSSSLVSVHLACQSLRNRECDLALAGGINLILMPEATITLSQARMLAPDGHCKTFDAAADGYVRGEGCGIVVLKRLSDAIAAQDNILAVIRGSAVNQDGPSGGLTVPNGPSQVQVIRQALKSGGVEPHQVSYVEAHGTGTSLGDPIEVEALQTAYGKPALAGQKRSPFLIGSVKTNIGHLEAAAGIAGLIKVVLSLQHNTIPPHLHFKEPNPHIAWDSLSLKVASSRSAWPTEGSRLASVSSFGFSGTNAHLVLEEAPASERGREGEGARGREGQRPLHLLTLSAKSPAVLKELASRYATFLAANPHPLADVCFTANTGRSHFKDRLAVVAADSLEAEQKLAAFARGEETSGVISGGEAEQANQAPKVAFLFTGQGSQYVGMGQALYESEPVFREALERCDEIYQQLRTTRRGQSRLSLLEVLYPSPISNLQSPISNLQSPISNHQSPITNLQSPISNHQSPISNLESPISNLQSPINQTAYTQPALFAFEYALAQLWKSYGIVPSVVMGHSVGEYVAACVAGVFSLEDGLKLVTERGRLMQNLPQNGEMVAVRASEEEVTAALQGVAQVSIAAINGPKSVVISGERQAVQRVVEILKAQGVKTQPLSVSHAFHSPLMEPMRWRFRRVTRSVTFSSPRIKLISNLTGKLETTRIATPQYWLDHILQPVRFADGMQSLHDMGADLFVEIGPKPTLLGMGRHCLPRHASNHEGLWLPSLRPNNEWPQLLTSLAHLYVHGLPVDWSAFDAPRLRGEPYTRQAVVLPTYPFKRERYWVETRATSPSHATPLELFLKNNAYSYHPLLGERFHTAHQPQKIYFESRLTPDFPAYLTDHRIYGEAIVPATAYLEMALAAGTAVLTQEVVVEELFIQQALILPAEGARSVQLILTPLAEGAPRMGQPSHEGYSFEIFSSHAHHQPLDGADLIPTWTHHASGKVRLASESTLIGQSEVQLEALKTACPNDIPVSDYYRLLRESGLEYGPNFQAIESLWRGEGEALGLIRLPDDSPPKRGALADASQYKLHPVVLDACTQILGVAFPQVEQSGAYLPLRVQRLVLFSPPGSRPLWSHVKFRPLESPKFTLARQKGQAETVTADIRLFDEHGQLVAYLEGFTLRHASRQAILAHQQKDDQQWFYDIAWQAKARPESASDTESKEATAQTTAHWLILADSCGEGVGEQLASYLSLHGEQSIIVKACADGGSAGATYQADGTQYQLNPSSPQAFEQLFSDLGETNWRGIVHLWSLNVLPHDTDHEKRSPERQVDGLRSTLHLVQALATHTHKSSPRLWLVTRGAQPAGDIRVNPSQSMIWGLGRVIAQEHPELQCMRVDLAPQSQEDAWRDEVEALFEEIITMESRTEEAQHRKSPVSNLTYPAKSGQSPVSNLQSPISNLRSTEVAFRDGVRLVARLARRQPFKRVAISQYGILDNLHLAPIMRRAPGADEVEIQVHACGLNFREVLNALGMLTEVNQQFGITAQELLFGAECAGVIARVGKNVSHLKVGDEVMAAQALGSMATFVTVKGEFVTKKPAAITHEEAATLPIACLTAIYAFHHLAKIKPGERVLIHSAAGGVGQAAVQLAQAAGAEIFATASPAKWEMLSSMGIEHIYNSRTLDFADQIMSATGGEGVNIVLNSFTEDFIAKSLDVVAENGRFVEIGKIGIWNKDQVDDYRPDVEYFTFDLLDLTYTAPHLIGQLLEELSQMVNQGTVKPLPLTVFPISEVVSAFRTMQQAKHKGKIVLAMPESRAPVQIRADASYLITGGLGALGLLVAQGLKEAGARHLILLGRRGVTSQAQQEVIDQLAEPETDDSPRKRGAVSVTVMAADVANRAQMAQVIAECSQKAPLRGIIHAAGVLDDGILMRQTWERFVSVMAPKVAGTWHLHTLTQEQELDFFVCFSSTTSLLGSPGQGNYAAANAFMDGLAHLRRAEGLPALSINWGPWAEVGMAAKLEGKQRWSALQALQPNVGLQILAEWLGQSGQVGVLPINWSVIQQSGLKDPFFEAFISQEQIVSGTLPSHAAKAGKDERSHDLRQELKTAKAPRTRLLHYLRLTVAKVLAISVPEEIGLRQRLFDLGLDSLMAVELRNRLEADLEESLDPTLLFDYPSLEALESYLAEEVLFLTQQAEEEEEEEEEEEDEEEDELDDLSEDELADLLADKLDMMF